MRQSLGVVNILIACHPTVDRLAQQVSQRQLGVLPPRIGQVLRDEVAESQTFVLLAYQNQATIGGDSRSLEIHLQRGIEGELKRLILCLTHWVFTSKAPR